MFTLYNATNIVILLQDQKIIIDHADRFEIPTDSDVSYNFKNKNEPKDMFKKYHSDKPIHINEELEHVCDEDCDVQNCSICEDDYVKWCEQYYNDLDTILPDRPLKDESIIEQDVEIDHIAVEQNEEQLRKMLDDELSQMAYDRFLFFETQKLYH